MPQHDRSRDRTLSLAESEQQNEARQYTVWSDLRAMKFLGQVQQDMRSLQSGQNRLQFWLIMALSITGVLWIALAICLGITFGQLQNLRQQVQPQSHRPAHPVNPSKWG
jgi:anti-sigma-K factor RskA